MGALIEKEVQLGRKRGNTSTDNSGENQGESRFIMGWQTFLCFQSQNLPCCSFFFKMVCINNENNVLFSPRSSPHVPEFFAFSIAKSYLAEDVNCTDFCACAWTHTCVHTGTHNHLFWDSCLFIANSPFPSFIYLCLHLECPCQLLLMERSPHYFSVIKKAIKLT